MSNFVSNKVLCSKDFLERYFLDFYPFGKDEKKLERPYITFNKLLEVESLNEYNEKYGENIYYGFFFNYKDIGDNLVEIKFQTKTFYPICAIKRAIELDHNIIWYAVEENIIYISKFEWDGNEIIEKTLCLETKNFHNWHDKNVYYGDTYNNIKNYDDYIWYFDDYDEKDWKIWKTNNLIERYKEKYPSIEYYEEFRFSKKQDDLD